MENKELVYIEVKKIHSNPNNPRKDLGDIEELSESIKVKGVMQNLTVVASPEHPGEYMAVIGHRRRAAAEKAGLEKVPCVISEMTEEEQFEVMMLENMQRNDLTIYEQAQGFQMMLDFGSSVDEIAEKTGFSKTTVYHRLNIAKLNQKELQKKENDSDFQLSFKDLTELEQQGMLKRTHGGAISRNYANYEQTSMEKEGQNVAQKQAIARLAAQYVHSGDVIALDTGTTTFELARHIVNIPNLTVITNDLKIAGFLEQNSDIAIVLLGGMVRHNFHCTIGSSVLSALEAFYVDTLFVATNGISIVRGLSTFRIDIAEIKRKMIAVSAKVVALADSTKINNETFSAFAGIQDIHTLVTDQKADREFVREAVSLGIEVVQAEI